MSISPSAVQLLSSHINAIYFGATVGPNLAIPLSSDSATNTDIAIGGSSLALAIASIIRARDGVTRDGVTRDGVTRDGVKSCNPTHKHKRCKRWGQVLQSNIQRKQQQGFTQNA